MLTIVSLGSANETGVILRLEHEDHGYELSVAIGSSVRDYMVTDLVTLSPDDSMEAAVMLERQRHIRQIPIVERGTLVGIVTDRDLKRAMPSPLAGADQQRYEQVSETTRVA